MLFHDRKDAGERLAARVAELKQIENAVVLALPRGGVPVGAEVARRLEAPLDVILVRKLGVPGLEELAFGAIARGGVRILNDEIVRAAGLTRADIDGVVEREQGELDRREDLYRGGREAIDLRGRTAILVDDGLATGATMSAAVQGARLLGADPVIVAVPVAPPDTCLDLRKVADEVLCLYTPESFRAVGEWYEDFEQTTDDEVRELLEHAVESKP